jgi:sugar lactone lactonase YvrE
MTAAVACTSASQAQIVQAWRLEGLAAPESVVVSADGAFVYVSNVSGGETARDGNGFISRVALDGRMLEREWAGGLNAPKGLASAGDTLYVADIDEIVSVGLTDGVIRARAAMPGARFLNDVAATPEGDILAADSMTGRIYALRGEGGEVWLEHPLLANVNGLLAEPSRLVVTTMNGRLLAVEYDTREIALLAEGLGAADGVAALDDGRYLVSEWRGLLHVVDRDGARRTLLDTRSERVFLNDFARAGDLVLIPNWEPGSLTAYRIDLGQTG